MEAAPSTSDPFRKLTRAVQRVGHLLPAQGPISVFVHHNTLHAFEDAAFETATLEAGGLFGCEPFLAEERYRQELLDGRIHASDLEAELAAALGPRGGHPIIGSVNRAELRRRILVHGIPTARGTALGWLLNESGTLKAFRADLPADAREALGASLQLGSQRAEEAVRVAELWAACQRAVDRAGFVAEPVRASPVRHRDLFLGAFDVDVDDWVHPLLIRFTSTFLDQGLADQPMPNRERGLLACFIDLYRHRLVRLCHPLGGELHRLLRGEAAGSQTALASIDASLSALGVPASESESFLVAEALALRGFAGMVHQFEVRPDRVPALAVPARLADFLAVRLLVLRAALERAARQAGFTAPLAVLRPWLEERLPAHAPVGRDERAHHLFHVAQLSGLEAQAVDGFDGACVADIEAELAEFDSVARRRILHLAYERHLRHRFFDAVSGPEPGPETPGRPLFQAIFCIDEREESIRRHLEEVEPRVETFGAAGFFGVAMYYQGPTDAHPRPLCPVAIRPRHYVGEVSEAAPGSLGALLRRVWNRFGALVDKNVHLGGRRAARGAVLLAALGVFWVLPLVLKVLFPWFRRGAATLHARLDGSANGRLAVEHADDGPEAPIGAQNGFTTTEMADIVGDLLSPIGIRERLAPLVFVFGHGSTSLNNPHESAHDCGACGGGRGGPNARAFAQMANHPAVRALLRERGQIIPAETWFIGGLRNTANGDLELFDEDRVPERLRPLLGESRSVLDEARSREAQERCRRFESAPLWLPPIAALLHVQTRATDLAQPRPEYGHATNAFCVIGRRSRTRGLFLDRRCFLVSYDPDIDPDNTLLERLLAAVVPVVAGINLEYLFGTIDPTGYGCGTKLPHNVTSLLGVMDGAQSDLRTGLPWQMLEIHEPVRLSIVVEARADVVERVVRGNEWLRSLVHNRWVFLASLDPASDTLHEIDARGVRAYRVERPLGSVRGSSREHYRGHRGPLPFVRIETARGVGA